MKKVSLIFAMLVGFVATSFAQGKCSMQELNFNGYDQIVRVNDIYANGIDNAEGEALYSVSLTVDVPNKKASNVVLVELATKKRWVMNLMSPINSVNIPAKCAGQDVNWPLQSYVFKNASTNMKIYFVPFGGQNFKVIFYLPPGPQDIKAAF